MLILMMLAASEQGDFFLEYYTKYRKSLYATAMNILKDPYLAEDAVQEVFIKLNKYSIAFEKVPEGKRKGYLLTMVRNQAYRMTAKEKKEREITENEMVDFDFCGYFDVEELVLSSELTAMMTSAIEKLCDSHQEILICRYYYDLSGAEIAEALDVSVGIVWSRLHRAMESLSKIIRKELDDR